MERERPHNPGPEDRDPRRGLRRSRLAAPLATVAAALSMGGEPAQQHDQEPEWQALRDIPELVKDSGVTFLGDRDSDLISSYLFAEQVAERYWEELGYGESACEGELKVTFTDEFADQPDYDPDSEPAGSADRDTCQEWLNSEAFADDPWGMAYTHTHESGHLRGFIHTGDRESLMEGDDDGVKGEEPPAEATEERFERQFGVEIDTDTDFE